MEQLIHSAALYGRRGSPGHVSLKWLEGTVDLLRSFGLRVREYGISANRVCAEGTYAFQDNNPELHAALHTESVRSLELYCHSRKRRDLLMDWEGAAILDFAEGDAQVAVPASRCMRLDDLLRRTYTLAKPLALWKYGIGYARSSLKAPALYAVGIAGGAGYYDTYDPEDNKRIGCWFRELLFARRHLEGYFRDVYPANLLSVEHVNAQIGKNKTLLTAGWGEFTQIDDAMWLWTVPDKDIPKARAALRRARLLICP
jgi:hypothetical protein